MLQPFKLNAADVNCVVVVQDDGERNKKIVAELIKLPENQFCADCGAKGEYCL